MAEELLAELALGEERDEERVWQLWRELIAEDDPETVKPIIKYLVETRTSLWEYINEALAQRAYRVFESLIPATKRPDWAIRLPLDRVGADEPLDQAFFYSMLRTYGPRVTDKQDKQRILEAIYQVAPQYYSTATKILGAKLPADWVRAHQPIKNRMMDQIVNQAYEQLIQGDDAQATILAELGNLALGLKLLIEPWTDPRVNARRLAFFRKNERYFSLPLALNYSWDPEAGLTPIGEYILRNYPDLDFTKQMMIYAENPEFLPFLEFFDERVKYQPTEVLLSAQAADNEAAIAFLQARWNWGGKKNILDQINTGVQDTIIYQTEPRDLGNLCPKDPAIQRRCQDPGVLQVYLDLWIPQVQAAMRAELTTGKKKLKPETIENLISLDEVRVFTPEIDQLYLDSYMNDSNILYQFLDNKAYSVFHHVIELLKAYYWGVAMPWNPDVVEVSTEMKMDSLRRYAPRLTPAEATRLMDKFQHEFPEAYPELVLILATHS